MNRIRKVLSRLAPPLKAVLAKVQGLPALIIANVLFWLSPGLLRAIDPSAATFDAGYLQRPIMAAVYLFFGIFLMWVAFQCDFPTLNQWLDKGGFRESWETQGHPLRIQIVTFILAFILAAYLVCLWLVPV